MYMYLSLYVYITLSFAIHLSWHAPSKTHEDPCKPTATLAGYNI